MSKTEKQIEQIGQCNTCDWWKNGRCALIDELADYEKGCIGYSDWIPQRTCVICGSRDIIIVKNERYYCKDCLM